MLGQEPAGTDNNAASETLLEKVLRNDRAALIAGVAVITAAAWIYTVHGAWQMGHMDAASGMLMPHSGTWTLTEFWLLFVMWFVMMIAMMLPSAAPLILLFASTSRRRQTAGQPYTATSLFIGGYLLIWLVFSGAATAAQWSLHQSALLSPMMVSRSSGLEGLLLLTAGVFQWTPWKRRCLRHCRSPLAFVLSHWRSGNAGAVRMGIEHGAYCTGCCWAVMALLFAGGVMNLLCVTVLTVFVLVEKIIPGGASIGRGAGVALAASGLYLIRSALI